MLEKPKGSGKDKRNNILTILNNIGTSIFGDVYFHYSDKSTEPKPESEESIAKRIQLRKQLRKLRLNETTKKENKINSELFERYFGYSNPSYMYEALNKTKKLEENKALVNIIEND